MIVDAVGTAAAMAKEMYFNGRRKIDDTGPVAQLGRASDS